MTVRRTDNPVERYSRRNRKRFMHTWVHYFDIYHCHFERFRGKPAVILEFGVYHGGSLQMWRDYFGRKAKVYGVDIDPRCQQLEEEDIPIFIGDQEDRSFLQALARDWDAHASSAQHAMIES
ncbi:MAG: hypothetical protein ACXWWL_07340 [Candidatus Limnocylindria bacterium]